MTALSTKLPAALVLGCISTARHNDVIRKNHVPASGMCWYTDVYDPVVKNVPAAKGRTNPAKSLSSFISFLFFAKVAIIFITLQRWALK
jgi:hypothetical protein